MEKKSGSVVIWPKEENDKNNKKDKLLIKIDPKTRRLMLETDLSTKSLKVSGGEVRSGKMEFEISHLDDLALCEKEGGAETFKVHIEPLNYFQLLAKGDGEGRNALKTVGIKSSPVDHEIRNANRQKERKVSGAYINVPNGELCAMVGMSGCGKSLFLEILAGIRRPSPRPPDGFFWFEGDKSKAGANGGGEMRIKALDPVDGVNKVGFVRQEDPLLGDLTLRESLTFRCRLMWPWMSPKVVANTVENAVGTVWQMKRDGDGWGKAFTDLMQMRIGAPLDRNGVLSGGQRRRANIAHELIGHPMALLMDEPTSGLSSGDAKQLVKAISEHAKAFNVPIVMCLHQPPKEVYESFHWVLIMAKPGHVLFHGRSRFVFLSLFRKVLIARAEQKAEQKAERLGGKSLLVTLETPECKSIVQRIAFFAFVEVFKEEAKGGKKLDEFPLHKEMRKQMDAEGLFPTVMQEVCKVGNEKKPMQGLGEMMRQHAQWNANHADAIVDFLGLLTPDDAAVLSDVNLRGTGDYFEEVQPQGPDGKSVKDPLEAEGLGWMLAADRLLRIWWELAKRSVCLLCRDKGGFAFLALQGIILALLLLLSFPDHGSDRFGALDLFAGTVRANKQFDEARKAPHDSSISKMYQTSNWFNAASPLGTNAGATGAGEQGRWKRRPESKEWKNPWHLDGHGRHRGTVLFVVAFAVLWMAVVGGAREISQDYPVIIHEGKLGVGPAAVALSRFAVLWAMSCWHAIPLVVAGGMLVEERAVTWYVEAWFSMACLGGLATASGLLISAWSRSQRMALVIVPFVTVPQVLFAGVLQSFPIAGLGINGVAKVLPLRLGWEALLRKGRLWTEGVVQFEWKGVDTTSNDAMGTFIKSTELRDMGWQTLYFGNHVWGVDPRWVMAGCTVGMMAMVWWRLRWRIDRGVQG